MERFYDSLKKVPGFKIQGILALFCFLTAPVFSQLDGWDYSSQISINTSLTGANIATDVDDFPLLVRLTSTNFDFDVASSTGADIRFTLDDLTTELSYEIERWNPTLGVAEIWVLVPTINGNDNNQSIYMWYGNPNAASESDGAAVFGSTNGYSHAWHLNENPAGGANAIKDRTSRSVDGTPTGGMANNQSVTGVAGQGISYDGTDDHIDLEDMTFDYTNGMTVCGWMYYRSFNNWSRMIDCGVGSGDQVFLLGNMGTGGDLRWEIYNGTTPSTLDVTGYYTVDTWTHVCASWDPAGTMEVFKNGVSAGTLTSNVNGLGNATRNSCYLARSNWSGDDYFNGVQDEITISNNPRSAAWVKLTYETQKTTLPATVTVFAGERSNQAPTNIVLSANTVKEGFPIGTVVGSFSTVDPDAGDSHTYSLVQGTGDADNGSFSIEGSTLLTAEVFDYRLKQSYSIRVETRDDGTGELTFAKVFTITIEDVIDPPDNLVYSQGVALSYVEGSAIVTNELSYTGDSATFQVTPALPTGLVLDPATGDISGTPTTAQVATTYSVIGTNAGGGDTIVISITINVASGIPTNLSYDKPNPISYTIGVDIGTTSLSYLGGTATSISIDKILPQGLIFNPGDGSITGTPLVLSPATDYIVTVTNPFGSGTYTLNIAVVDAPQIPANISYTGGNVITYMEDVEISGNILSYTGEQITSVTITPDLPAGLSIDPVFGTITGTPTEVSPSTDYTLTLTNVAGIGTQVINLTVVAFDPTLPEVDSITSPFGDTTMILGESVPLTLHFSSKTTLSGGNLRVHLNASTTLDHYAIIEPFTAQDSVQFEYVVQLGDNKGGFGVTELKLDEGATIKDYVFRNLDLSFNIAKNLPFRSKINLSATRAGLVSAQVSQGGGDTLGLIPGVILIIPPNPAINAQDIFAHQETATAAPGFVVGPNPTFSDATGNPLVFPDSVEVRLQLSDNTISPEDYPKSQVYLGPETAGGKWTRVSSTIVGNQHIVRTDNLREYIVAQDNTPPVVSISDPLPGTNIPGTVGVPLNVSYTVSDNVSNPDASVKLYNVVNNEVILSAPLNGETGVFQIPGEYVGVYGMWFVMNASDGPNSVASDTIDVVVANVDALTSSNVVVPGNYQLLSVPMVQTNPAISAMFDPYWGAANPSVWRIFDYDGNGFVELNSASLLETGKSYWVRSQGINLQPVIPAATAFTPALSKPFEVDTHTGWNCLSNPFMFNIYSGDISSINQNVQIYAKDPALGWVIGDSLLLSPWSGFIFKNPSLTQSGHLTELKIPPTPVPAAPVAKRASTGQTIGIVARSNKELDGQLIAGYNFSGSILGEDRKDYVKPPMDISSLQISWKNLGEGTVEGSYLSDVRGQLDEGFYWTMDVQSGNNSKIELEFYGLENIPQGLNAWVLDRFRNKLYNLGEAKSLLELEADKRSFELELIVGNDNYLAKRQAVQFEKFAFGLLKNFPNPFTGITYIPFSLPGDGVNINGVAYELSLYDVRGQKIMNLEKGVKKPGSYIASWNGRQQGKELPAGVYLVKLRIDKGSFKTMKIIKSL